MVKVFFILMQEMKSAASDFAKKKEHANSKAAVVAVLSHGENGCILGFCFCFIFF